MRMRRGWSRAPLQGGAERRARERQMKNSAIANTIR
jgi:hypothetical protein